MAAGEEDDPYGGSTDEENGEDRSGRGERVCERLERLRGKV